MTGPVLRFLAIVGLVAFLLVRVERTADAAGEKTVVAVGLWFSPWYVYEKAHENLPGGGFRHRFRAGWTLLSWSWLCLVPVVVYTHRVIRPAEPPAEAAP